MANLLNFLGIPYLVGKIKFKLFLQGPLALSEDGFYVNWHQQKKITTLGGLVAGFHEVSYNLHPKSLTVRP